MDTTVDDRMMDGSRGPRSEGVHASRDSRIGKVEVRASRDSRIGKVGDAGRRARRRLRASWTIEMTIEMGRDRASRELLATNRVDLVGKLLRHVAHLGAKIGHGVEQRLHGRRVGIRVHLEHDSVIGRVRVLVPGEHHVRVFV